MQPSSAVSTAAPTALTTLSPPARDPPWPLLKWDGRPGAGVAPARRAVPWRLLILAFVVWNLLGLCQTAQSFFFPDPEDGPLPVWRALGVGFGLWYTWAALWLLA